jgi:hypothetical protein
MQMLDAYKTQPYVNRSKKALPTQLQQLAESKKEISDLVKRVNKAKPVLPLTAYTGSYRNEISGDIIVNKIDDKKLEIVFGSHKNLKATLDYMDKDEWLMRHSKIAYGIFLTKFEVENGKVSSVKVKANDFVKYDPYVFVKE